MKKHITRTRTKVKTTHKHKLKTCAGSYPMATQRFVIDGFYGKNIYLDYSYDDVFKIFGPIGPTGGVIDPIVGGCIPAPLGCTLFPDVVTAANAGFEWYKEWFTAGHSEEVANYPLVLDMQNAGHAEYSDGTTPGGAWWVPIYTSDDGRWSDTMRILYRYFCNHCGTARYDPTRDRYVCKTGM